MASTYTDGLGIELIGTGDRAGSWGDVTNNNLQSLEQSIRGVSTVALSGAASNLNIGDGSTASETATDAAGRSSVIIFTGSLSGTHTVTLQVGGTNADRASFVAMNETTQNVVLSRGSGNTVTIPSGYTARIFLDGTDARNALANLKLDKIRFENDEITNAAAGTFRITGDIANLGESSGTDDVYLTTPSGSKDLVLQTNGITSGRSKIVIDSADNGNIDITPHGTGSVVISKADINSGTIDGTTIGGAVKAAGNFSTVDIDGGTIDGTTIGGVVKAAGNFSTVDIDGGTIDGTIVGGTTPAAGNFSTVDIDGGTIDGATLNASTITNSPISGGSGSFTTLSATGTTTTAAINASGDIDSGGNVTASNFTADANGNISTSGTGTISTASGNISSSSGNITTGGNISTYGTGSISSNRKITAATGITATSGGVTVNSGGLTVTAGGAILNGGINNNNGGIVNTGNISGAGTIGSGAITSTGAIAGTALSVGSGAITGGSLSVGTGASNTVTAGKVTTEEINHATSITSKIGAGNKFKVDTNGAQVVATNGYLNMSSTSGSTGFGFRNNSGTLEIKNSSVGSWGSIAVLSGSDLSVSGSVTAGTTVTAGTGLTVAGGGASITGNSTINGTLGSLTGLTVSSGGATITAGGLTVSAGGASITGNSTINGTLGGLTGLTVTSGGASISGNSTVTGTLGGLTGLTVASGGASITGGLNNNNGNITNAGTIGAGAITGTSLSAGAGTISTTGTVSGSTVSSTTTNGDLTIQPNGTGVLLINGNGTAGQLSTFILDSKTNPLLLSATSTTVANALIILRSGAGGGADNKMIIQNTGARIPNTGLYLNFSAQGGSTGTGFRNDTNATVEFRSKNTATADTWGRIYHSGMVSGDGAFFEHTVALNTIGSLPQDYSTAHSLGAEPRLTTFLLKCTDAAGDRGWSQGDVIQLGWSGTVSNGNEGLAPYFNSTSIGFATNNNIAVQNAGGSPAKGAIDLTKWSVIMRAWL
jgi:fibronectin-binding autotransporter adhesin